MTYGMLLLWLVWEGEPRWRELMFGIVDLDNKGEGGGGKGKGERKGGMVGGVYV